MKKKLLISSKVGGASTSVWGEEKRRGNAVIIL